MISIRLERFSYRFAEQVLNSKLALKQEVEAILTSEAIRSCIPLASQLQQGAKRVLRGSRLARSAPRILGR